MAPSNSQLKKIAEVVALPFGVSMLIALIKNYKKPIITSIKGSIKHLAIALALLLPAAFIEILITPLFLPK